MKDLVKEVKKKREFSKLPDSIVERAVELSKGDVKDTRALLRKYFGVFLTNRVLKRKGSFEEVLKMHMSSKKRNYNEFYKKIFEGSGRVGSVIDLGAGVNGFSYPFLEEVVESVKYFGVEASGQLVDKTNFYFGEWGFDAKTICLDLFDIEAVLRILRSVGKPRIVFMFQVVDALESLERNFSKKFILEISKECEGIVLSLSTESLGGRKRFNVLRKWLVDFLKENFVIEKDFEVGGERIIWIRKK